MSSFEPLYHPGDRIRAVLLLLAAGVVYLPFLGSPLVFDDVAFFRDTISAFADRHFDFTFRWLPYSSLGVTWVLSGEAPAVFRLQNLLLHGLNALLLLLLLRLWIALLMPEASHQKAARYGAWLGALVFACHPIAVYGVGYLVQRSVLMATLFALLMQLAYLRGLVEGDRRLMLTALAAYFLAVFSKEHSLLAPAVLLPLTWLLRTRMKLSARALAATWGGFAAIALFAVLRATTTLGTPYESDAARLFEVAGLTESRPMLYLLSILTQAGLFFKYCLLMLVPNPAWMSIDIREAFIHDWRDWTNWLGMAAFVGYGIFALRSLLAGGRRALLGLALLYPWCNFFVEFSSIRVQEIFVLYRSYLWLPGLMLLLPLLCAAWPERKVILAGLAATALLIPPAWNRLWVFADEYRLWDDAARLLQGETPPGSSRIYYNRARAAAQAHNREAAIADYRKSLAIDSSYPEVNLALASALMNAGRGREALAEYDKVIAAAPENAAAFYGKGFALRQLNDVEGALEQMNTSCRLGLPQACVILEWNRQRRAAIFSSGALPSSP